MKLKNVSLVELHIEKIILGVVVVYALAVIWLFMLGNPYKAKIPGESTALTPVEVEEMLLKEARSIEKLVEPGSKSQLPPMAVPDYYKRFMERLGEPALDIDRLASNLGDRGFGGEVIITPPPIFVDDRSPPAPIDVKIASGHGVMDIHNIDEMDQEYVKLAGLIPTAPRDFRYVSLAATFPQAAWKKLVDDHWEISDGGSRRYWVKLQTILDVVLERQTLDPITKQWGVYRDGKFVADVQIEGQSPDGAKVMGIMVDGKFVPNGAEVDEIAPLPDTVSVREHRLRKNWADWEQDAAAIEQFGVWRVDFEKHVREFGKLITEMQFAPLRSDVGPRQVEPGEDRKDWDQEDIDKYYQLNQEIHKIHRRLLQIGGEDALKNLDFSRLKAPSPVDRTRPSTKGGRFNTRPSRGGSTEGGSGYPPARRTVTRPKRPSTAGGSRPKAGKGPSEAKKKLQQKSIEIQRNKLMKLMQGKALIRAKYLPDELKTDDPNANVGEPGRRRLLGDFRTDEVKEEVIPDIPLLAHDLSVQPGMTYRYRVRVAVLNPLFRNSRLEEDVIARNFDHIAKISEPSEWSKQVRVLPRNHFFVVGATGDAKPEARVEIWHLFNGKWYRSEFSVKPGQLIGGKVEIALDETQASEVELNVPMIMVGLETAAGADGTTINRRSKKFLYLDLKTNQLLERDPKKDREDDMRKRLLLKSEEVARRP